jgi:PAS domain S-box-containing protein
LSLPATRSPGLMLSVLRKPLTLFALVLLGHFVFMLIGQADARLTIVNGLLATVIAGSVALLWDFFVQRPVRQGLGQLEDRMRRLSGNPRHATDPSAESSDTDTLRLERMLATRQRRIADYTRRLRRELERFKAIYRHSHDAVLLFAPRDGRLLDCNPRTAEFLGIPHERLNGMHLTELHDESEAFLRSLVDDVMDRGEGRSIRINYRAGDGRIIPAEVSTSRIQLDTGNLLLCIARDISELLKELARRLRRALREEDTVARLGGDEFVVLLEGLGQRQDRAVEKAREIAEKIRGIFVDEYRLNGHELYVTASIGIVTFPHDGDTVDTLLRHADTAMYHAKGAGRDGARVFERRMDEAAISRLQLENELRNGLREGQFELYFQPVLVIRDGRVLGAEVLLRWHHPAKGMIAPTEFLPYIENCALMLKLDDWVLLESCRLLGAIQDDPELQAPDCLAINISHQQFHQPEFVDRVKEIVAQTGADPRRLQFEITETMLIKDTHESIERMTALKQMGIRFAIDDFGTGYSSLADLRQLPIDTLKIDRSFVRDIASDPNDAAIVRAILSMAQHIGLKVIAEGVETREQLHFLRNADCTYYQGYLGRPPLSAERFREELRFNGELYAPNNMPPPGPSAVVTAGLWGLGME